MANSREIALSRLDQENDDDTVRSAKTWLSRTDTKPVFEHPVLISAHEAFHLWRVRLKNALDKGHPLSGATSLVARLETLAPQQNLEQYSFIGPLISGNLFFEETSGRYVGSVLIEKLTAVEQFSRAS